MTFFRKVFIGRAGIAISIMIAIIFFVTPLFTLGFLVLFISFGLLEFIQIDLQQGLIRRKIFFYGLSFGQWQSLENYDHLIIGRNTTQVSDTAGAYAGSYEISSRFLILGSNTTGQSLIIKKGDVSELKKLGKELHEYFPHLELTSPNKRRR